MRRSAAISVFCLLFGTTAGASRALDARQTPTIRQAPTIAKDFVCAAYDGMTLRHVEPLRASVVPEKDLEIRVWRGDGQGEGGVNSGAGNLSHGQNGFAPGPWLIGQGLILRRQNGVWSGERLTGSRASLQAVDFVAPITKPDGGWERLWAQLQAEGILTLPNQPRAATGTSIETSGDAVSGFDTYLIETNQGGVYRGSFYDSPEYNKRPEDRQVAGIIRTLHDSLYSVSEARRFWQEAIAPLPAYVQTHLMNDAFTESRDARDLPDWVKQTFEQEYPGTEFTLANPGEAFPAAPPAGSSSSAAMPPLRRLSFLAVSGDYCVVAYEYQTGRYGQKTLLFHKASPPKPFAADVYQASSEIRLVPKNLREVRTLQAKGQFLQVQEENF